MRSFSILASLLVVVALGAVSVNAAVDIKKAQVIECEKGLKLARRTHRDLRKDILQSLKGGKTKTTQPAGPANVNCVETGNTAADCLSTCAVATATETTAKSGTGTACAGDYTCTAGDGACPAAKKSCKCTDGTAAGIWFDTTCETDGAEDCKDCNIGYILKDQACEAAPTTPPTPAPPAKKEIGQSCSEDSECDYSCSMIKIAASGGPCYPDPCPGGDPVFVEAYWTHNEDSKCQIGA